MFITVLLSGLQGWGGGVNTQQFLLQHSEKTCGSCFIILSLTSLKKNIKAVQEKIIYFQFTRFSFCLIHKVSFPSKKCTYVCPNTQDQTMIMWPLGLYFFMANTYPHVKLASLAHELYCLAHWLLCSVLFCFFSLFLEAL